MHELLQKLRFQMGHRVDQSIAEWYINPSEIELSDLRTNSLKKIEDGTKFLKLFGILSLFFSPKFVVVKSTTTCIQQ